MAKKIYPSNDAEFAVWLANLINKGTLYKTELNLNGGQMADLQNKLESFNTNLALKQQKKEESIAQTSLVNVERLALNKEIGLLNNAFKSIRDLPPNIIEELGLSVSATNFGTTTPSAPLDLVVTGTSDGINHLKWRRNNNRQGTTFIVEAKTGNSESWTMIDAVTGSFYKHKNQAPGVKIQYRIKAKRGEFESGYSNPAVVYG